MQLTLTTAKALESQATALVIDNEQELINANELAKEVKKSLKEAKEYKADEIKKAHKIHKDLLVEQKQLTEPLKNAEKIIKNAISEYMKKVEQENKRIEAERKEEEELFGVAITENKEKPKLEGTYVRKTWKARIIDEDLVPVKLGKMVIRPVDQKALNDIAQVYKGTKKIDGVEFYQEESVVIR